MSDFEEGVCCFCYEIRSFVESSKGWFCTYCGTFEGSLG